MQVLSYNIPEGLSHRDNVNGSPWSWAVYNPYGPTMQPEVQWLIAQTLESNKPEVLSQIM